jgi:hypothetical protein
MLSQLCNKCGLFERTHNRARPEQFPHKRGPLASSSLKVRTSPPQHSAVPPVSALPPHQYNHPSIAPLLSRTENTHTPSRGEPLPQIQSWLPSTTAPAGECLPTTKFPHPWQIHSLSPSARIVSFSQPVVQRTTLLCVIYFSQHWLISKTASNL